MKQHQHLNEYIQSAIRDNWEELALTDFHGVSFQYRDVSRKIAKLHLLFQHTGVVRGDKVALCGRNSAQWAIAALACLPYGAVAVPILHDFKSDNIHHLVTHSDAKLFFVDEAIWENLDADSMPGIAGALLIADYTLLFSSNPKLTEARAHLNELFGHRWPDRFTADDVKYPVFTHDTLALINYTSGSTGFSKGVMLSYGNLWSNIQYGVDAIGFLNPGDGIVCMLPLAHMYGLAFEMIHSFVKGCHLYFLTRTPSPKVIMEAFATVRPKLIITVTLIIEKIIRTRVFPMLDKPLMKLLMHIPLVDDHLLSKIKDKIEETFGGRLQQMVIGGAGLNGDVEAFLRRIKFPFTVGYGMTECAPLITYAPWDVQRPGSCGRIVDRMEARIDSPDPQTKPGVLFVRGANVMQGYYKNPEATASAITRDGWLNTGDICSIDKDGFLTIRGRDKSMILGPSGQNIYPEEIEQKLNSMLYVAESLVVDDENKLVALIYPDFDNAHAAGLNDEQIEVQLKRNIDQLNTELPAYSQISRLRMLHEEFEKTPKRSIKRYLYQH